MLISYWRDNIPTLTKGNEDAILYSDSSCENPIHLLKLHLETLYLLSTFGNTSLSLNLQVSAHCSILNLLTTQCKKRVVWNAFYSAANLQAHIYNTSLTTLALFWRARLWKRCLPPPCTSLQFCFNLSSCSANQYFSNFNSLHSARSFTEKQDLEMVFSCWHSSIEHKYAIFTNQQISVEGVKIAPAIFTNPI